MNVVHAIDPTGAHLSSYCQGLKENQSVENIFVVDAAGDLQDTVTEILWDKLAEFGQDIAAMHLG